MSFIDSHCHLDFSPLSEQLDQVLMRAEQQGVKEFVVPSVSITNIPGVIELAKQFRQVHIALGLHPCFMHLHQPLDIDLLADYVASARPCAIGEIGLDFFITSDVSQRQRQLQLAEQQLALAQQFNLPVIVHVRKAHDQLLMLLKKLKFIQGGIVHAYSGSAEQAQRYINEFGFKLGFGGTVTYQRSTKIRQLASQLPLWSLVLETDAPDMPLFNMQLTVNQPANIRHIAEVVCELRHESSGEIERQIKKNTLECLKLRASGNYLLR